MHKMSFAEKFCVCERCGQTWKLIENRKKDPWGQEEVWRQWQPVDPDYEYRPSPEQAKKSYYKKKRRRGR